MGIVDFYDLDAWKENHKLVLSVYKLTRNIPKEEKFGLIDQIRRAVSSITANIAEGFGRYHFKDKIKFFYQARGSLREVQNFLILIKDLKYVDKNEIGLIWKQSKKGEMLISGLIRSTESKK